MCPEIPPDPYLPAYTTDAAEHHGGRPRPPEPPRGVMSGWAGRPGDDTFPPVLPVCVPTGNHLVACQASCRCGVPGSRCWRRSSRRSFSSRPPQIPKSCLVVRAYVRQGRRTRHAAQTALAWRISAAVWPVDPIGKNSSGSAWRQAAASRHPVVGLCVAGLAGPGMLGPISFSSARSSRAAPGSRASASGTFPWSWL